MTRRWLLTLLAALALFALAASSAAGPRHAVQQRTLANGLRVVVSPDADGADVSVLGAYRVGARGEPGGLEGIAHLAEHLMFTGSKHVPGGGHFRYLARAGATLVNAQTDAHGTAFHETVPPDRLELALWLESDRMGYLTDRLEAAPLE